MTELEQVLTEHERFLLEWLAKENASPYGECRGKALDRLVALGLAWIAPVPDGVDSNYADVSVTVAGRKALGGSHG